METRKRLYARFCKPRTEDGSAPKEIAARKKGRVAAQKPDSRAWPLFGLSKDNQKSAVAEGDIYNTVHLPLPTLGPAFEDGKGRL